MREIPIDPIPVAGQFDKVGVDVLQLPKSFEGNQYAIVFVDYLTKWPEVFAVKDQSALTICKVASGGHYLSPWSSRRIALRAWGKFPFLVDARSV